MITMKQNRTLWILATIMLVGSITMLTSCKHDSDDYVKKPYSVTDDDRLRYAEKKLGITIDRQQDWTMSKQYSIKVTADADLENITQVSILDGNPYVSVTNLLTSKSVTNNETVTISFLAPAIADMFYAACITEDGECIARPFIPGEDTSVSFDDALEPYESASSRRAADSEPAFENDYIINSPFYSDYIIKDFENLRDGVLRVLPDGKDNHKLIGAEDFRNVVEVRENPSANYQLYLQFIYGDGSDEDNIWYNWYPNGKTENAKKYLIKDKYKDKPVPKQNLRKGKDILTGHNLYCRRDGKNDINFAPGDILEFHLANGETPMVDTGSHRRVKVFMFNGYVFVACEDGNDWDYNDRIYLMPFGQNRIVKAEGIPVKPEPSTPQIWTYAWEDNTMEGDDRCDYDMNDCVLEVQEKADDPTMLQITIVALGATRDVWLGFENKNGKSYKDYTPVFNNLETGNDQELHALMKVNKGEMVNTGNGTRTVEPYTAFVKKPAGFDFQTCSFVLGAKVKENMRGVYENDYYMLRISTAGTDPHGVVIPGKWQWPTERTSVKDAYSVKGHSFAEWAADRTKAKDWYKYPVADKVVKR